MYSVLAGCILVPHPQMTVADLLDKPLEDLLLREILPRRSQLRGGHTIHPDHCPLLSQVMPMLLLVGVLADKDYVRG